MMLHFTIKAICIVIVLLALVAVGDYATTFVGTERRETLATLLGAAATIFAGWLAWESATIATQRAEREKIERANIRKEDVVVAITPPVHAAAVWLARLDKELSQSGDRDGKSLRIKRTARQVNDVLDRNLYAALLDELGADDRLNFLMIVATLNNAVAMSEIHFDDVLSTDDLNRVRRTIAQLETHLSRFDSDLHEVFLRDSGLEKD